LVVVPIIGDFTASMQMPPRIADLPLVGFFPGSTIGNFSSDEARAFLCSAKAMLGEGAHFIIGADLVKSPETLVAAYDDAAGVTRAFNKNLLARINRELDGRFDLESFSHRALWNESESRIEMHLVSDKAKDVMVAGRRFRFAEGESIHTENSHKYQPQSFVDLAATAGWRLVDRWISPEPEFGVFLFRA
jgi:dimethylhistidine N-methyltransferase